MNPRSMLSLPALVHGPNRWRLPLCDATAMALALALADSTTGGQSDALVRALAADPALAVFGVCSAWLDRADGRVVLVDQPTTIAALSSYLSPRLFDLFAVDQRKVVTPFTAEQHGRFAALVAESVAAAHDALRTSGHGDPIHDPTYLAALAGHWREWLAASTGVETLAADVFPQWPFETPQLAPSAGNSPDSRAAVDEAWRRWLTEISEVQSLLPAIVAQIVKRRDLEANFDKRLHEAKLDSLKEFAYGAGHELNNPLANIASRAQTLLTDETNPERRRRLAAINTQAFRAHEMLADMMLFARPPQLELGEVNLVQLITEVLAELAEDAAAQQTLLSGPIRCDSVTITADPVQLRVALRALCINSLEARGEGGHISVELCLGDTDSSSTGGNEIADMVQIVVTDDGPGIPTEIRERIFDPFFSGREAGRGLGFGLSKCWRIVTLHGGKITVQSDAGRGASFTLTLPTGRPAARSA